MAENPTARPPSSAGSPASPEIEEPTAAAELHIMLIPDSGSLAKHNRWSRSGGSLRGTVPPHQARSLVTTLGELASLIIGVGGAVLTLCSR
jgi:hypothetical protein